MRQPSVLSESVFDLGLTMHSSVSEEKDSTGASSGHGKRNSQKVGTIEEKRPGIQSLDYIRTDPHLQGQIDRRLCSLQGLERGEDSATGMTNKHVMSGRYRMGDHHMQVHCSPKACINMSNYQARLMQDATELSWETARRAHAAVSYEMKWGKAS